jgi:predicted esterase
MSCVAFALPRHPPLLAIALLSIVLVSAGPAASRASPATWQETHDRLVTRLRADAGMENAFGPAYQPLYHAALPWYERWGGRVQHPVDDWMVPPEDYAAELADALEHGRNYFAANPGALLPLVFETQLPGGRTVSANYWIILPTAFPETGRTFPLVIGLHGSGWLGHPISFVRKTRQPAPVQRTFSVTPIDEGGPWQIDFLNALLDRLLATLPIDPDRVYLEGHSLGAMATWEWALDNPERFAALSPRAGRGEPFRAIRLKNVPAWVIHGANDDVVPSGFSDQMVTALQSCDAGVRYSVLKGGEHNMPSDLDEEQIIDWYLRQTRSHASPPPDPTEALHLGPAGFSPWEVITIPGGAFWESPSLPGADEKALLLASQRLFQRAHDRGELVDSPVELIMDLPTQATKIRLAAPRPLRTTAANDPAAVIAPPEKYVRFHFRGQIKDALAHLAAVKAEAKTAGLRPAEGTVSVTPLTLWYNTPGFIAEYRMALQ